MIKNQINQHANEGINNLIKSLSANLKSLVKHNKLEDHFDVLSNVSGIPYLDLVNIYNARSDNKKSRYSLRTFYQLWYLTTELDKSVILKEVNEAIEKKKKANNVSQCDEKPTKTIFDVLNWNPNRKWVATRTDNMDEDIEFIDKVNENLMMMGQKDCVINTKEALEAKKAFEEDIKMEPKSEFQKQIMASYDNAVKEAQMELFGTTELLDNQNLPTLHDYIIRNNWEDEFDWELKDHRQTVLMFLYKKLEDRTRVLMKEKNNITAQDEKKFSELKKKSKKKFNESKKELDALDFEEIDANKLINDLQKIIFG